MEKEILSIITNMLYNDKIEELYSNRSIHIEFPPKLSITPNFKVLSDFCDDYFTKYEKILLENALIYALDTNDKNYRNHILKNRNQLKKCLEEDRFFRIKTCELAFKNIINKEIYKINRDEETKKENPSLFKIIDEVYTKITSATILYRKILLDFLNRVKNEEKEILLDNFLLTDRFDKYINKLSEGTINNNEINNFKYMLSRLIMYDNYLHIESLLKDNIILKNDDIDEFDEEDYDYDNTNIKILNHIKKCINNNNYNLPNNIDLRYEIYSRFITYNTYTEDRINDYNLLKNDKEKVLNLKKINPFYKLEFNTKK